MHKSQKAATGVLSGDRTQDALHSCAEPTAQLPFQLCSHSLGRFVDWLVRAPHLDRYRVRPGCGRGQRPPRSPWWYEAMRPPALSNRLRRPGCVHPPQLGQRLRRKLCHVLRNIRRPRGIVSFLEFSCVFRKREKRGGIDLRRRFFRLIGVVFQSGGQSGEVRLQRRNPSDPAGNVELN